MSRVPSSNEGDLINTPLQRGACAYYDICNRLSGFAMGVRGHLAQNPLKRFSNLRGTLHALYRS